MRLMLGNGDTPELLVEVVETNYNPNDFAFDVVNGLWEGRYINGHITVLGAPSGDFSSTNTLDITCDDQNRLRGDYKDVFDNFHDETYVGPTDVYFHKKRDKMTDLDFDDDIPF
jgi:hypothetical protein